VAGLPDLTGRVAFVAGASRGIGAAIAHHLARAGASVAVAARTLEEGQSRLPGSATSVAHAITEEGGHAVPVHCDVTDEGSVEEAVGSVAERFQRLDIVVCNAGITWLASIADTPLKRWDLVLRVNLTGTFLVTRSALPHLLAEPAGGSLIAITTTGVAMADLGANAYWVAKAGVERLFRGLAAELEPSGVAVNCLAPAGVVLTEGWQATGGAAGIEVPAEMVEDVSVIGQAAVILAAQDAGGLTGGVHLSTDLVTPTDRELHR
jgi:NAD(P)-dependent dehydrogenase (short-subunit alcohol dehydrogenase family)